MKNVTMLSIVALFVLSIALSGCGKLNTSDFEMWRDDYVKQTDEAHTMLQGDVSKLDGKVDNQNSTLTTAVGEKSERAKEDAIAYAEQGDADTIKKGQDADSKLRTELTKATNDAGKEARNFATGEDDKLRSQIKMLDQKASSHDGSLSQLQNSLMMAQEDAKNAKAAARKPMRVATVHFMIGQANLTAEAMKALDSGIAAIKENAGYQVKVVGHADGTPVLGGKYRSNWDLSQARAASVAKYLMEKGITGDIDVVGRAHTEPVAAGNTKEGKMRNRRAEVIIHPPGSMK